MRQIVTTLGLICFPIFLLSASADTLPQQPTINKQNVQHLEKLAQFEQGSLKQAFWTPDGQYIYVSGSLGLWRFNPQNLAETPIHFDQYHGPVTFSSANRTAASLDGDGNIILWDFQTGEFIEVFYDTGSRLIKINDLAFSSDGSQLAMGFGGSTNLGLTGAVTVWDVKTRETFIETQRVVDDPVHLDFSADGTRLAAGGYGGVAAWDTTTWELLPMPYGSYIANIEFNADVSRIGYWDWRNQDVELFDLNELDARSCILSNSDTASYASGDIAFSPTDHDLLAVNQSGQLALWKIASCELLTMIPASLGDIAFSPDGSQLVGIDGSAIHIYAVDDLAEIASTNSD